MSVGRASSESTFDPPTYGPVWLASRSLRRRRLLAERGIPVTAQAARVDDGHLVPGRVTPRQWVASLAYFKARAVADDLWADGQAVGTVLAADTICVHGARLLGQPRDVGQARTMLETLRDDLHVTMTGVCLIALADARRWFVIDEAVVRFGSLAADVLDAYLASGAWQGKAGAYNLQDRLDAGWDIRCSGDPTTVMGLPMQTLEPWFRRVEAGRVGARRVGITRVGTGREEASREGASREGASREGASREGASREGASREGIRHVRGELP